MQKFDTKRNIILSGVPPDVDISWFTKWIRGELEKSRVSMLRNNTEKFGGLTNTAEVPDFLVERDWVKNTPYEVRDKDDPFPAYTKQALQVTCESHNYEFLESIFFYMLGSKRLQQLFGPFARIVINCGPDADMGERIQLREDVEFHAATCNNQGRVVLAGLNKPDYLRELHMEDDHLGERESVYRSVREIFSKIKLGGIKLWQSVVMNKKGLWVGYYTEGVGGDARSAKATNWGESFGGNLFYYMADRGVQNESIEKFLKKTLTSKGAREAFSAKRIDGMVYSPLGASRQQQHEKAKNSSWFDYTKGMSRNRKAEYEAEQRAKQDSDERAFVKPGDKDALNFDDRTVGSSKAGSMNFTTAGDDATMGSTKFVIQSDSDDSSSGAFGSGSSWQSSVGDGGRFENFEEAARDIEDRREKANWRNEREEEEEEDDPMEEGQAP